MPTQASARPRARKIPPPYAHQKQSGAFCKRNERVLDASDPGTGKTRVHAEAFIPRAKEGAMLVLAPKSLLQSAWQADMALFTPSLTSVVATAKNRVKAFATKVDVYITNTDAVVWLAKQKPAFFKRFVSLVIDESSAFKHHTSQRSKALNKIKKYFKYRSLLTGTPNTNTITDLWHQMFVLDDGKRLGSSFFKFRNEICDSEQTGPETHMRKWYDKPHAELTVSILIKDLVIRHKFEECIDIPPNHEYSVPYELTITQNRVYAEMERHGIALLAKDAINTVNAAGIMTKLMQISSGASYSTADEYSLIDTERYELVADLIDARKHSIVFFQWTHQRDELIKLFEKRGITFCLVDGTVTDTQREQYIQHFQAGFYRVFLAHPMSAAHGLTLTKATTTIWPSPTINLEHFLQGNKRAYRATQTQKTETIVVVAKGTIEERVFARLQEKGERQASMLSLLKSHFQDRRK